MGFAQFALMVGYILCEVVDAHFGGCGVSEGGFGCGCKGARVLVLWSKAGDVWLRKWDVLVVVSFIEAEAEMGRC